MDVVYPTTEAVLPMPDGTSYTVRRGQHWHATDDVVTAHPEAFSSDPRFGLSFSTPPAEMAYAPGETVEMATDNPGEVREVRRGPGRPRRIQ